ncbi:hypothetical protein [Acinetobacter pragensis]|uniref:Uncharacterized protein n=1 Tax=Acinetobacter pragensis TaxID=1806892 RepID=A0A151XYZ5_9GAMM|nr:hypothetical protein [Acinetobacter pragensis]KYQ71060.1 hypothetical protein AZH43_02700 [Acinetobacter pragensis]
MTITLNSNVTEKETLARNALYDAISFRNVFTQVVMQFIQHHLDTVPAAYWTAHFGTPKPSTEQIIEKLELDDRSFLNADELTEDERLFHENHLDFILPADVSIYALCVSFEQSQMYSISIAN